MCADCNTTINLYMFQLHLDALRLFNCLVQLFFIDLHFSLLEENSRKCKNSLIANPTIVRCIKAPQDDVHQTNNPAGYTYVVYYTNIMSTVHIIHNNFVLIGSRTANEWVFGLVQLMEFHAANHNHYNYGRISIQNYFVRTMATEINWFNFFTVVKLVRWLYLETIRSTQASAVINPYHSKIQLLLHALLYHIWFCQALCSLFQISLPEQKWWMHYFTTL